jgi:ElaB/YqjD/DUF883 family membrane-anchored ribosome-binding protein
MSLEHSLFKGNFLSLLLVLLWIRSLALVLKPKWALRIFNVLDDLRARLGIQCIAKPRRQLHAFFRKCDANYTPQRHQAATPATRVPAPVAITDRYVMLRPLLGVGCPAAVGFVNRVIANPGAKSSGRTMTARRNSIGDLAR